MIRNLLLGYGQDWRALLRRRWPVVVLLAAALAVFLAIQPESERESKRHLRAIESAHAVGKAAHTEDYVAIWWPAAGKINACLAAVLLLAAPVLLRDPRSNADGKPLLPAADAPKSRRRLCLVTAGAMAASAWLNFPRLSQSLWGDEETTMRRCVVGEYVHPDGKDAPLVFNPVTWQECLFFYRDPNNHPFFSVLSKLSHDALGHPKAPEGFYFSEWAIRLPAYLFGLAGLAALAWLASVLGMPRAGMVAVVWLALHPWHVRYGVDARGYSLLFALLPLALAFLAKAAQTRRVRWWLAFGLSQFLVIWAYPGALYFLLTLNLSAAAILLLVEKGPRRWSAAGRWSMGVALGAMISLQMLLPCLDPMRQYLKRERISGSMDSGWFADTFSQLFSGMHWHPFEHGNPYCIALADNPALAFPLLTAVAGFAAAGAVRLWKAGPLHRGMLLVLLLPAPLMVAATIAAGNILYSWYLMIALPGLALLVGCGADAAGSRLAAALRNARIAWAAPLAFLAVFGIATARVNGHLRQRSVEPNKESVLAMRSLPHPETGKTGEATTFGLVMHTRGYDPAAVLVDSLEELQTRIAEQEKSGIPCWVHFADFGLAQQTHPQIISHLLTSGAFQMLPPFYGQQRSATRYVFQKLPAPKPAEKSAGAAGQ